jgi:hypothetical protein
MTMSNKKSVLVSFDRRDNEIHYNAHGTRSAYSPHSTHTAQKKVGADIPYTQHYSHTRHSRLGLRLN